MFNSHLMLATFSPSNLFNGGEQGVWFDPSDFSTMFQDDAGATPVTAVGDPVGLIRDKSGRGNHASQATSTKRPVLRQDSAGRYYLEFDGTDDALVTASINPGSVDKVQAFAGVRKLSDAAVGVIYETSVSSSGSAGATALFAPGAVAANYAFRSRGSLATSTSNATTFTSPITNVVTGIGDIANDTMIVRVNGTQISSNAQDQGTGNYQTYAMYIGARAGTTVPLNGRIYGLIVRYAAANLDTATVAAAENWMNGKTGAY